MIYLGYTAIQEELSNHENLSVKCAVKMREKLVELNQIWDENEFFVIGVIMGLILLQLVRGSIPEASSQEILVVKECFNIVQLEML